MKKKVTKFLIIILMIISIINVILCLLTLLMGKMEISSLFIEDPITTKLIIILFLQVVIIALLIMILRQRKKSIKILAIIVVVFLDIIIFFVPVKKHISIETNTTLFTLTASNGTTLKPGESEYHYQYCNLYGYILSERSYTSEIITNR